MAAHFAPCSGCGRHIRVSESACPFCATATSSEFRARPAPAAPPRRLGRAALFAFTAAASATGVACSSESATPVYGAPVMDTGSDVQSDTAVPTDSAADADAGSDAPDTATMPMYGGPFDTGASDAGSDGG